jgi:hypothetical protein
VIPALLIAALVSVRAPQAIHLRDGATLELRACTVCLYARRQSRIWQAWGPLMKVNPYYFSLLWPWVRNEALSVRANTQCRQVGPGEWADFDVPAGSYRAEVYDDHWTRYGYADSAWVRVRP